MSPTKRAARQIPRQLDDEEDDEALAPPPRRAAAPVAEPEDDEDDERIKPSDHIRRGMSAARQVADSTSSFAATFKLTEQIQVIKFLEDDCYASYTWHWVDRAIGRRSYTCRKNFKKKNDQGKLVALECPLCKVGDKPGSVSAFNIAVIGDDGVPVLKSFDCGPKILGIIENYVRDPKVAPLTKGYFLASKSGKMGTVNYQIVPIKAHSLVDDYDIDPPSAEELAELELYTADVIKVPKVKELEEVAAEIADEY